MTDLQATCLRVAVTLARTEQIGKIAQLRKRLCDHNFSEEDIKAALEYWANYEKKREIQA